MNWKPWQMTLTAVLLFAATVLLAGCLKKPAAAGASLGSTVGAANTTGNSRSATGSLGGGVAGTITGAIGVGAAGEDGTSRPGTVGFGVAGATGTTIPMLPSPKEFVETSALRDVHFDFDRHVIRRGDEQILADNARWLKANPTALLLIEGHADERGTNEYNLALGERRGNGVRDYLVSLGVEVGRMTVISYGEERPTCTERTEACWAQNRRAHFLVKQ